VNRIRDQIILDTSKTENQSPQSSSDTEVKWKAIKQSIQMAADEVLGTTQRKMVNAWFDQGCQTVLDIKKKARKIIVRRGTRANALEYADAWKEEKTTCHTKKKEY
jgi:hypothetical protein